MLNSRKLSIALASCLALAMASIPAMAAEGGQPEQKKPSLSDSPYANGPPPITGGYTDTTQGGSKGSGDMQALPPGVKPPGSASAPPQSEPQPKGTPSGR